MLALGYFAREPIPSQRSATLNPQEVRVKATTVPYESLARTPATFQGQIVTFRGKVIQVTQSGANYVMRVNVNRGKYDTWTDTIYVNYQAASQAEPRILQGDIIQLWGEFVGIKSYTAVLGQTIQIPQVVARAVEATR